MTEAVCFSCGELKFGGFLPCRKCKAEPKTEEETVYSLVLTDHYFDRATLEQISQAMKAGGARPDLPPEQYEQMAQMVRKMQTRNAAMGKNLKAIVIAIVAAVLGLIVFAIFSHHA